MSWRGWVVGLPLLASLAGCLADGPTETSSSPTPSAGVPPEYSPATALSFGWEAFEGGNLLVLELLALESTSFKADLLLELRIQESVLAGGTNAMEYEEPCWMARLGATGGSFFGRISDQGFTIRASGQESSVRQYQLLGMNSNVSQTFTSEPVDRGKSTYFAFGLRNLANWSDRGEINATIKTDRGTAFAWRPIEAGRFECLTRPTEFQGGSLMWSPGHVVGQDLSRMYEVDHGILDLEVGSDTLYELTVKGPKGNVANLSYSGTQFDQSSLACEPMEAGEWTMRLARFVARTDWLVWYTVLTALPAEASSAFCPPA